MSETQPEQLLTIGDVAERFNVCPTTIRRWCEASLFPQPIRFNRRLFRWRASVIEKFLNEKQTQF